MKKILAAFLTLSISTPLFAATAINLAKQPATLLLNKNIIANNESFSEINRNTDFNQTLHIRIQETYQGIPVLGGDAVIHQPHAGENNHAYQSLINNHTKMNGIVYKNIHRDLKTPSSQVFNSANEKNVIAQVIKLYQDKYQTSFKPKNITTKKNIYIDEKQTAHWAYQISFYAYTKNHKNIKPAFIIDAENGKIYQTWNDFKTFEPVLAGGYIGNHKTGQKELDDTPAHLPAVTVSRDPLKKICYMKNEHMILKDKRSRETMSFACTEKDAKHNFVYWNGNHDQIATTWSPSNDVMFGIDVARKMYSDWYQTLVLTKNKKEMQIHVTVHDRDANAGWMTKKVVFGDSIDSPEFNPFTQLDTVVHELSHGFTEQHSDLAYALQSGGLNESFSDMAGITSEYYLYGKTDFLVGVGDVYAKDEALRFMDMPSKDCHGRKPGKDCSIDHLTQYKPSMEVHFTSGIFNRAFYQLATSPGWDAKKAFEIMVHANKNYWTSHTTFYNAACDVKTAAMDYKYDTQAVVRAFQNVGINVDGEC